MKPDHLKPNDQITPPTERTSVISVLVWLTASLLVTIAISFAASRAPARIRLIGLFPIGFGSAVGWMIARLSRELNAHPSRRILVTAAVLLTLAGWIGVTGETYRLEELHSPKLPSHGLAAQMMKDFERQVKGTELEIPRPDGLTLFRTYLSRRIQKMGAWRSPWPECFLFAESIVASIAAVAISRRVEHAPSQVQEQDESAR